MVLAMFFAAELQKDSVVEVFLVQGASKPAGKARCARSETPDGAVPPYGFRFIEKTSN